MHSGNSRGRPVPRSGQFLLAFLLGVMVTSQGMPEVSAAMDVESTVHVAYNMHVPAIDA